VRETARYLPWIAESLRGRKCPNSQEEGEQENVAPMRKEGTRSRGTKTRTWRLTFAAYREEALIPSMKTPGMLTLEQKPIKGPVEALAHGMEAAGGRPSRPRGTGNFDPAGAVIRPHFGQRQGETASQP
jgi:hypothetical protein